MKVQKTFNTQTLMGNFYSPRTRGYSDQKLENPNAKWNSYFYNVYFNSEITMIGKS